MIDLKKKKSPTIIDEITVGLLIKERLADANLLLLDFYLAVALATKST